MSSRWTCQRAPKRTSGYYRYVLRPEASLETRIFSKRNCKTKISALSSYREKSFSLQSFLDPWVSGSFQSGNKLPSPFLAHRKGSLCHLCSEDVAPRSSQEFPVVLQAGQRPGTFPITGGFSLLIRFLCLWLTQSLLQRFHLPGASIQDTAGRQFLACCPATAL